MNYSYCRRAPRLHAQRVAGLMAWDLTSSDCRESYTETPRGVPGAFHSRRSEG